MNPPLSKVKSPSKIQETPQIIPNSPQNKFKRTNKKDQAEETNATSEITQSIMSQDPNIEKTRVISRTVHSSKQQDSKISSQIEDSLSPRINNLRFKTQPNEFVRVQNFIKKGPLNIKTEQTLGLQNGSKQVKSVYYEGNVNKRSSVNSLAQVQKHIDTKKQGKLQVRLRKAPFIIYILDRLFKSGINAAFKVLLLNKQILKMKNQKQVTILIYQMSQISKRFEKMLKTEVINRCKLLTSKKSKQNYVFESQFCKLNNRKIRENLLNYLNLLYKSTIRNIFLILKKNKERKQLISKGYPALFDFYQKRKLIQAFEFFKDSSRIQYQRKNVLLNQIQDAFKFCSQIILMKSFRKIVVFATSKKPIQEKSFRQNTSLVKSAKLPSVDAKRQKQKLQKEQIQNQIKTIQQKTAQRRREQQTECKILKKVIQDLKEKKKQGVGEVNQKKSINEALKVQAERSSGRSEPIDFEQQNKRETQLPLLQELYFKISKISDQNIPKNMKGLVKQFKLDEGQGSTVVQQWLLIQKRIYLQKQIDGYQNELLGQKRGKNQSNIAKALLQQNQIMSQMIKSYVKQRYLWGEVQKFVANVL